MKKYIIPIVFLCMIMALTSCVAEKEKSTSKPSDFYAEFLSTGKSDCMIIRMDDMTIMCDTADNDDYDYIMTRLSGLNATVIDVMILTHFDKDHIGSADNLIRSLDVKKVYIPNYEGSISEYSQLLQAANETDTELIRLTESENISTDNGKLLIDPPSYITPDDDNNNSLITEVEYGETRLLLTGDALKNRLSDFIDKNGVKDYDVIKLPHHGDYNKALLSLFSNSNISYGIITSDGNYSTVEGKLVENLEKYNIKPLYTCHGAVVISSDGKHINVDANG